MHFTGTKSKNNSQCDAHINETTRKAKVSVRQGYVISGDQRPHTKYLSPIYPEHIIQISWKSLIKVIQNIA